MRRPKTIVAFGSASANSTPPTPKKIIQPWQIVLSNPAEQHRHFLAHQARPRRRSSHQPTRNNAAARPCGGGRNRHKANNSRLAPLREPSFFLSPSPLPLCRTAPLPTRHGSRARRINPDGDELLVLRALGRNKVDPRNRIHSPGWGQAGKDRFIQSSQHSPTTEMTLCPHAAAAGRPIPFFQKQLHEAFRRGSRRRRRRLPLAARRPRVPDRPGGLRCHQHQ